MSKLKELVEKATKPPLDLLEGKTLLHIETRAGHPDGWGLHIASLPKTQKANAWLFVQAPELAALVVELAEALKVSNQIVEDSLQAFGKCDNSVGICNCDMQRSIDATKQLFAKVKALEESL